MHLAQIVLLSHTITHSDSWPLYPKDEAYAFAETGQETQTGDGDVPLSSGSLLAVTGKNDLLVIEVGLLDLLYRFISEKGARYIHQNVKYNDPYLTEYRV